MKFDLLPASPDHIDTNPFRTAHTASPILPRHNYNPFDNSSAGASLGVQTTLPKAKSLVREAK